jgi:hypothetical protein
MKYSDADRIELARWLHVHAHRLSKRRRKQRFKSDAEQRLAHARNLLWSAARTVRALESATEDPTDGQG